MIDVVDDGPGISDSVPPWVVAMVGAIDRLLDRAPHGLVVRIVLPISAGRQAAA